MQLNKYVLLTVMLFCILFISNKSFSQNYIQVDTTTYTPQQLVQNILVTGCLQAFNVHYTGQLSSIGYFNAQGTTFNFSKGVVLTTGKATDAAGPNDGGSTGSSFYSPGDANLSNSIGGGATNDAAILEFDFIPSSDIMDFRYIFGSEEYPEFANSSFNDVFAFFLTGPNPAGGTYTNQNIAIIPGTTTPVSINNVNNGDIDFFTGNLAGPCMNCQYYVHNGTGDPINSNTPIQYDGYTTPLTATANVVACQTYHIKLAIADVSDAAYDSGVFLEAGSFSSGDNVMMSNYSFSGEPNQIYEGCENYYVFSRADATNTSQPIDVVLTIGGTASIATDIDNFPTNITIPAGQVSDTIFYTAILDNLPEGTEYIVLTLQNGCPCNLTNLTDTIWINDRNIIAGGIVNNTTTIMIGECVDLTSTINLPPQFVSYQWSSGATIANVNVCPPVTTTYYLSITDACGQFISDSVTIIVNPPVMPEFNPLSICVNEQGTINYTGTYTDTTSFSWNFGTGVVISGSGIGPYVVSWSTSGPKNVTVTVHDGIFSDSYTGIVNVKPLPTTDFAVITPIKCFGDNVVVHYTGTGSDTTHFTWNFGTGIISSGGGTATVAAHWTAPGSFPITLESVTDNGCSSLQSTSIMVVNPNPVAPVATTEITKCFGSCDGIATAIVQGGTPPYTYAWNSPAGSGNSANNIIPSLCAGDYNLIVSDVNGCTGTAIFTITSPVQITYTGSMIAAKCFGSSDGSASVSANNGIAPYTYVWSNGQVGGNMTNIAAGTYYVTIYDSNSCSSVASFTIGQPESIKVIANDVAPICIGGSTVLTASVQGGTPNYIYYWNNGDQGQSITVSPTSTTQYEVSVVDANGCESNIDKATVTVYPPLNMRIYVLDDTICPGDYARIKVEYDGGNGGPYTLRLEDGTILSSPFAVSPETTHNYTITLSDDCETPNLSMEFTIVVLPKPPVEFKADFYFGCQPLMVQFSEVTSDQGQTYVWDFGENDPNNLSLSKNPLHEFRNYGYFDIKVIVTSTNGCKNSFTWEDMINVYPKPEARFFLEPLNASIIDPYIWFDNHSINSYQSFWSFGDGDSSQLFKPNHTYNKPGTYIVELIAVSEKGCRDTTLKQVLLKEQYSFYAPTAFTPDKDGINELFSPVGTGIDPLNYHLYIYSRWGALIFETTKYSVNESGKPTEGWDGRVNSGRIAIVGTYPWVVVFKDKNGVEHQKSGNINVIR